MGPNRWIRPVKLLVLVLLVLPLLTGCWDRLEIEERSVVLGISVDVAEPEAAQEEEEISHFQGKFPAPEKDMIRVAVQIALPGRIPLGPGESGGGDRSSGQTVWVINVVGHTVDDAIMNLQQQISGRLFFGHLRVIVVSEAAARRGLQNLNDYFRRNPEVRRMAWMMISKGNAQELMTASPKLERVPSLYLISTMDSAVRFGKFPNDFLGIYWSYSSKKGQEGFLPYVEMMKEQNIQLSGLAYFKGDKMVGVTKPFEIAAYMGIKGITQAGYRGFVTLDGTPDKTVTIQANSRKSEIEVQIKNGLPHFTVSVFTEINVEEKISEQFDIDQSDILKQIEQNNREGLVKTYQDFIAKTQENESDVFGFGEYVRAKQPQYWNQQIKTKEGWQEMYKNVSFDVNVSTKIRRIGMKAK